jgi:hypothetical protein
VLQVDPFLQLAIAVPLGAGVYVVALWLLRVDEIETARHRIGGLITAARPT